MLKHVLMFRLKAGADKEVNTKKLKDALEGLKKKIPEVQAIEVGVNVSKSPASYDIFYHSEFADEDALEKYRSHPEHRKVIELIDQICSDKTVVDYWG